MIRHTQVRLWHALLGSVIVVVILMLGARSTPEPDPGALIEMKDPHRTSGSQQSEVFDVCSSAIRVLYSERIEATTFRATLNGQDVTALFHPQRRSFERVELNEHLHIGMNELVFEAAQRLENGKAGRLRHYRMRVERKELPSPPVMGVINTSPPPLP